MNNKFLVLAGALAALLSSCNTQLGSKAGQLLSPLTNIGVKQTLDTEVTDLVGLRQGLEGEWSSMQGRVASVERDVEAFGPNDSRLSKAELKMVGNHVLNQETAEVIEAGNPAGEVSDVVEGVGGQAQEEASKMSAEGKRIMHELKSGIPTGVKDLSKEAASVVAEAATIRYKADNLRGIAEKNALMTDEDMRTFESNSRRIDQEINALAELADKISREGGEFSSRLTSASTRFQSKLSSF